MGKRWTEEEIQYLESAIASYTVQQIANKLNRSYEAVKRMLSKQGLSGFEKSTDMLFLNQVSLMFGVPHHTIEKKWKDHGLHIMKRSRYKVVRQEELIKFLRDNPEVWNAARVTDDSLIMNYPWYKEKRRNDTKKQYFWTPEELAKLQLYYEKGFSIREIAEKIGRSYKSVEHKMPTLYRKPLSEGEVYDCIV